MNIGRHNYEEYFILYMDNELNDAEKIAVENFVQNNPDLKDELDTLLQSKLIPDNSIVFDDKEELMKFANGSAIDLTNYEEWLTLYIDDELTITQRIEVEKFVATHPQVQNDLLILQKTKLQPEETIFPYKESLYRRTEKVRIIQMRWWRVAAAVILLLALSTTVILVLNKKQPKTGFANSSKNNETRTETNFTTTNPGSKNETIQPKHKEDKTVNQSNEHNLVRNHDHIEKKSQENKNDNKNEPVIAHNNNNSPSNNLPQEPLDNPNLKKNIDGAFATIDVNPSSTETGLVTNPLSKTLDSKPVFANNLEEGDNKSSRGFFRKAVRFIEKRTGIKPANDDDRVLIGGLAVKL